MAIADTSVIVTGSNMQGATPGSKIFVLKLSAGSDHDFSKLPEVKVNGVVTDFQLERFTDSGIYKFNYYWLNRQKDPVVPEGGTVEVTFEDDDPDKEIQIRTMKGGRLRK